MQSLAAERKKSVLIFNVQSQFILHNILDKKLDSSWIFPL